MSTPTAASRTVLAAPEPPGAGAAGPPDRPPLPRRSRRMSPLRWRRYAPGYAMLLPFALLFVGFLIWPMSYSLYLAFTEYNGVGVKPPEWVGLRNFQQLWFEDPRFRHAVSNTFTYVFFAVSVTTLLALGLALAFRGSRWWDRIMRTIFFLPAVTSSVAVLLIWRWIFTVEDSGLGNSARGLFGLKPIAWLAEPGLTVPILVLMAVWGGAGYGMVLYVAGLNAIPEEYYEQARIDGASAWRQFRHITLPLLRPVTTYVVITGLISAFQIFEAVYIVYRTQASNLGGILDSGLMLVPYLYDQGFNQFELGLASAIAWSLFLIIFVIALIQLRLSKTLREM